MSFLQHYRSLAEGTEIPPMFGFWCGISGVAACLGRNTWVDMGVYKIFPNFYIILVAGSGHCRKSSSIDIIRDMVTDLNDAPKILGQKMTTEALIGSLIDDQPKTQGTVISLAGKSEGYIVVRELKSFLNRKTYENGLSDLLIETYDCPSKFTYSTKSRGDEVLKNVCLNFISASTIEGLRSGIPPEIIAEGYVSRVIFAYIKDPPPPVPLPLRTEEQLKSYRYCMAFLEKVRAIRGAFSLTTEAQGLWSDLYMDWYKNSQFFNHPYLRGYASRRHTHMMKLAMVLSLNDSFDMTILPRHLESAKDLLEHNELYLQELTGLIASNETGVVRASVYEYIRRRGSVKLSELMHQYSYRVSAKEMAEIISTLIQSHQIDQVTVENNKILRIRK